MANNTLRVFVSIPMHERTASEIRLDFETAKEVVVMNLNNFCKENGRTEKFSKDEIEWLTGLDKDPDIDERIKRMQLDEGQARLYLLSDSMSTLATCDFIYMCPGFNDAKGCMMELLAATMYEIGCLNKADDLKNVLVGAPDFSKLV